jgi:hypothetical protein
MHIITNKLVSLCLSGSRFVNIGILHSMHIITNTAGRLSECLESDMH